MAIPPNTLTAEIIICTKIGIPKIVHADIEIIFRNASIAILTSIHTTEIVIRTNIFIATIVHNVVG